MGHSTPSRLSRSLIRFALVLAGLVLVISFSGAVFPAADSINILAPYWLFSGLALCGLTGFIQRKSSSKSWQRLTIFLTLAYAGAALFLLFPLMGSHAARTNESPDLRLVSYNMYKANPDPASVAGWITQQNADIVILLEADQSALTDMQSLQTQLPYTYDCLDNGTCSTLILSRIPARRVQPLATEDANNRKALSAVTALFPVGDALIPVTAVHQNRPWPLGDQVNDAQILNIAVQGNARGGIMAGDFNSAPWTFAMRRLARAGDMNLASGATGTWPSGLALRWFRLPLDEVYLGPCLAVSSIRRGPSVGSDHFPLIADIKTGQCDG